MSPALLVGFPGAGDWRWRSLWAGDTRKGGRVPRHKGASRVGGRADLSGLASPAVHW
ncbi:hypothetical protein NIES4073_42990 [Kalymmatonema gypsitolerans NIES-4073]|nr:hypothetical protein NIES4073_42990 [Scytonema sp. NIES-4073]